MSDSAAEFKRKNDAQFALLEAQLQEIGKVFIGLIAEDLVFTTPGPGLQLPGTEYVATGRMRGGWRWSPAAAPEMASNFDAGPFDAAGFATVSAIETEVAGEPLAAMSFLWNDVGYSFLVHEGRGRHPYPRPWRDAVRDRAPIHADAAIQKVMGR